MNTNTEHPNNIEYIPNTIFFCYFGGRPFKLINYLAVKSAYDVNNPTSLDIYVDTEPEGEWWEKSKKYLNIIHYNPPKDIFGLVVNSPAHQADIARLLILIEKGGIYLDLDVICNRPFKELIDQVVDSSTAEMFSPIIMGEEHFANKHIGFCSAVILASKDAKFLKRWLEGFDPKRSYFKGFRSDGNDLYYSELSTKYTKFLNFLYPEELVAVDRKNFFYPNYSKEELKRFFDTTTNEFDESYAFHLWSKTAWDGYLKDLTEDKIIKEETAFTKIVRRFIEE